jgi:hypothetical protein
MFHWDIDDVGICFNYKVNEVYWIWPWVRKREKYRYKYYSVFWDVTFNSLKDIDELNLKYDQHINR